MWINVPTTEYFDVSVGDVITLDYYDGALGFAYWIYSAKADEQ